MTTTPQPGLPDAGQNPPPPPPPIPDRDLRTLRRSAADRKVAGVCGGLGRWADIDPVVFRIVLVVLAFFGGLGLIAYGALWLVVPLEGEDESEGQRLLSGRVDSSAVWAIIAILLGLSVAGGSWAWAGRGSLTVLVLAAVVVGIVLVQRSRADAHLVAGSGSASTTGGTTPGGSTVATATHAEGPTPGAADTTPLPPQSAGPAAGGSTPAPPYAAAPAYAAPRPPRERSILGGLTVSLALIAVGLVLSWGFLTGSAVDAQTALSIALGVVGLGLLAGTFFGRGRGLIVLGVILSLIVLTTGVRGVSLHGGVGQRTWHPTSLAAVQSPYELSVGDARLDLSDIEPGANPLDITANLGMGNLVVVVPDDVAVDVRAHVGTGNVKLPQGQFSGVSVDRAQVLNPSAADNGTIVLHLQVGMGEVEVRRA